MYTLIYTVCVSTFCISDSPEVTYSELEQCFQQGAILSGMLKADVLPPSRFNANVTVVCEALGEKWELKW